MRVVKHQYEKIAPSKFRRTVSTYEPRSDDKTKVVEKTEVVEIPWDEAPPAVREIAIRYGAAVVSFVVRP